MFNKSYSPDTLLKFCSSYEDMSVRQAAKTLGIPVDADEATIKAAQKVLVRKYHPDNLETGDAAKFREVMVAYKIMMSRDEDPFFEYMNPTTPMDTPQPYTNSPFWQRPISPQSAPEVPPDPILNMPDIGPFWKRK